MHSSIPLSLTNKTLSAASGKTYHLVDKSGEPLKVFFTKIVDEQLVIYTEEPSISSEETPQAPELVIDDYQQASFVAPQDTVISGSGAALFETTSNIEPASILFFILCKCCFFFFFFTMELGHLYTLKM
ncbi:hypothetical protein Q7476_09525 [Glaesserella parasuis]|nr:hypothetical protein [Glaesserella parasuis]MDP0074031.1 hypothetical protein [Glaesserella parasuis]MDP0212082.1 hypothetical protein [Glaesserella parasuis]